MTAGRVRPRETKPELQVATQLAVGLLLLFMGGIALLVGLGLIEGDQPPGPAARVVAFAFGAVITWAGAKVLLTPLWLLAEEAGARDPIDAISLGVSRLLDRVDLRSLGAAALLLPLAADYARAARGMPTWLWSSESLVALVSIEFLLIHGFPFLVVAASIAARPAQWPRVAGLVGGITLLLLYGTLAWGFGGLWAVGSLLYLMAPNILPFARRAPASPEDRERAGAVAGANARMRAVARWVVQFASFAAIAILLDERDVRGEGNLRIGLFYFALQLVVELFRVSEIPADLGPAWARVPVQKRRAVAIETTDRT